MKFSMTLTFNPIDDYLPLAKVADEEGWHSVNAGDGLFFYDETTVKYPYSDSGSRYWSANTPFLDPFNVISAMGQVTENVRFLINVLKLPVRNPMLVAKMAGTTAYLTQDRLDLGVGLSVWPEDFLITETDMKTRGKRCSEAMEIMRKAFTGEFFEHHGEFYDIPSCSINPVPGKHLPIIIGGTADLALRRAAREADGFVSPNTTSDKMEEMVNKIHGYRKEYGTDDKPFQMTSVAIDAFDLDGHKKLEAMGIDQTCDMPWLYYGGKFNSPLDFKIDAVKRFGDEVISKMG
jgi:alkanesulfonate monooxygenase SsuD/methylene tetrahydromethanopterin reductase-like flavin-dependent oxidoreductase (luciferase family)